MKRIIIVLLLLCISVSYCFFSYKVLKDKNNEFENLITECQSDLIDENLKQTEENLKKLLSFWDKNKKLYRILVDGSYCETISERLSIAEMSYNVNEAAEAVNSLNECKATLNHILEKEKLSFEAVF